jgi:uncharacterized protein
LLTADLVRCRRYKGELRLSPLDAKAVAHAEELAEALIAVAVAHVGQRRDAFDEACEAVVGGARDRRLALGLRKLVEDRCAMEADPPVPPEELRRDVFLRAAAARKESDDELDRRAVLAAVAAERGMTVDEVEHGLFADLRGAHAVVSFDPIAPRRLVEAYDLAQAQAVLLRAVRIGVDVECASPGAYRMLFRKLKFLRLLHTITPRPAGGYHIDIDGPFSLFESVTRYGLQLAMALPVIRECDRWSLTADLRWGTARTPLSFAIDGGRVAGDGGGGALPDDIDALVRGLAELDTPWQAAPADAVLDLPGVGVCVPDLVFTHQGTGECVYLEVLGYWSRAAVWKRVELIERGLGERIVFAVGKHLRVSEEALGDELPGALYVYKRTMSARALVERVEALSQVRVAPPRARAVPAAAEIDDDGPGEDLLRDCPPAPRSRTRRSTPRRTAGRDR